MSTSASPSFTNSPTPAGLSIIAGARSAAGEAVNSFASFNPMTGGELPELYHNATTEDVNAACIAAAQAMEDPALADDQRRGDFLDDIATRIEHMGDALLEFASQETGLAPTPRLSSERDRTVRNLRMFASVVRAGQWRRTFNDPAVPDREPTPRPRLRTHLVPLGPIAVFGSSNFPLAYSTAGTDASSALAAGCPIVVKGHPCHPGTGEIVAQCITAAARATGMPAGIFSFLHSGGGGARESAVGKELVTHNAIRAVGFTGSHAGGMALARLAMQREGPLGPDPVRVFAEMGSVNPVFITTAALQERGEEIANQLSRSVLGSSGQQCTKPGLIVIEQGPAADAFLSRMSINFAGEGSLTMLSLRIREAYHRRLMGTVALPNVKLVVRSRLAPPLDPDPHAPGLGTLPNRGPYQTVAALWRATAAAVLEHAPLREETFGPSTVVVVCDSQAQFPEIARTIAGTLTASVFWGKASLGELPFDPVSFMSILMSRAGRVIVNGVPTGVEISPAMVHGGPYPATSQPQSTAVGARAIERWCRPVCVQGE
ncbi:MAG: aldehyde dehydrogenase family protein [Planctomycetes bacterium]|nr:aldehyde dehydrogenase family protein [Planctomycetota bacterium]